MRVIKEFKEEHLHVQMLLKNELQVLKMEYIHVLPLGVTVVELSLYIYTHIHIYIYIYLEKLKKREPQ